MASSLVSAGKAYFSRILNSYFGPYLENFNKDQLAFGLSSGKLTLTNLRVKKSALDKFDLPFECVEGRVGLFSVSIPWFSLGRSPVVIRIEDIHVVIGPSKPTSFDPKDFERRANAVKMEKLERAEAMNFSDAADGGWLFTILFLLALSAQFLQIRPRGASLALTSRQFYPAS